MNVKTSNILKVVVFSLLLVSLHAQDAISLDDFVQKKQDLKNKGMIVLTTWASANIISGSAYFITKSPEEKYFYGMNCAWGAVNLAIAIPSLLSKKPLYKSKFNVLEDQIKKEKVFLINAGLDIVYVAGGITVKEVAKNQTDNNKKAMFLGFGNSFILQGGALFLLDVSMTALHAKNRKKYLNKILENTEIAIGPGKVNLRIYF
ncbi:MAG TPA: hypothetical protein VN026_08955 [Bacteroidia bacterium]|jgi:hypothetical protein|nr:hypothetical protein [Bacteroidia bacterium]